MKGFNVYLKAGSQSCQLTLATITGAANDRRQGVKERSNFLMSAVTGIISFVITWGSAMLMPLHMHMIHLIENIVYLSTRSQTTRLITGSVT